MQPALQVGDLVETNEAMPRAGHVTQVNEDDELVRVCFDDDNTDCQLFTPEQLNRVEQMRGEAAG